MDKSGHNPAKLTVPLSLVTLIAAFPSQPHAQTLACFENLIFGEIAPCGSPGSVTVNPDNSRTASCVTAVAPFSRARCIITQSTPIRPVQISITAATFTISNGTSNMNVNNFNIMTNAGGCCTTITSPLISVPIGATLSVGSTQATGTYNGSFGISAVLQ